MKSYSQTIDCIKVAFRVTRVWKEREGSEYAKGWNNCIKEQKKKESDYLKYLDHMWKDINKDLRK